MAKPGTWMLSCVESKMFEQTEGRLLAILDDKSLGVDKDNVFLAIALIRKLTDVAEIEEIDASADDNGEVVLDITLKNDSALVLFLDYKNNIATSYIETDSEIKDFKEFSIEGLSDKIKEEIKNINT